MSTAHLNARGFGENIGLDYGTEDELSAPLKPSRNTSRNSLASGPSPSTPKVTPSADLRQLAAIVRKPSTPRRRETSVGASLSHRHVTANTPNTSRIRCPLAERTNPSTPHALRAFQKRRTTPGRDRRKSGRHQRETPRDALRNLSKVLAPTSQPTRPSPQPLPQESSTWEQSAQEELEHQLDLPQPRFSIAIDDEADGDDSFGETPPRLSMPLEDREQTGRSIEVARHVANENQQGELSRGSFGSIGPSDQFSNISAGRMIEISQPLPDDSIMGHPVDVDVDEVGNLGLRLGSRGETEDLQRAVSEPSDKNHRHPSGVGDAQDVLETDTHSAFILNVPRLDFGTSSPIGVSQWSLSLEKQQHGDQGTGNPDTQVRSSAAFLNAEVTIKPRHRRLKTLKRSCHGISYPSLPPGITKKIATSFVRILGGKQRRISKDTLGAIMDAGDLYLQQLGDDLSAFSSHAGRKKVDESDVIAVMKRQRQLSATATPLSLAQRFLPAEMLREVRLPVAKASWQPKKRRLEVIDE